MTQVRYAGPQATAIKEICRQKGISMHKMEIDLGYANGYIGKHISDFPYGRLIEMATYLGVDPSTLTEHGRDETISTLQSAFDARPEMRVLFSLAAGAKKEDVELVIKTLEALKK